MLVKLKGGFLESIQTDNQEIPAQLDKPALLVYCGNFNSMDGMVEIKDEHVERLANNHNSYLAQMKRYILNDKIPLRSCPPIQLDHSVSAHDTVGRLVGELEIKEYMKEDGIKVKALYGTVRILGKENVEKVLDGRWTHLSIGADLEEGKIQELTITPFPAAAEASLLAKGEIKMATKKYKGFTIKVEKGEGVSWFLEVEGEKQGPFQKEEDAWRAGEQAVEGLITQDLLPKNEGDGMLKKLTKYLMNKLKLSEKDAEAKMGEMDPKEKEKLMEEHDKLKKHLMDRDKLSEEDAEKKLAGMNENEVKELALEKAEQEKLAATTTEKENAKDKKEEHAKANMSEEDKKDKEDVKKMRAAKTTLSQLSTNLVTAKTNAKLAAKRAELSIKFNRLKSQAKITPAELKKIDLVKLSEKSEEAIKSVLDSYENRETVILAGLYGSKKALSSADVVKHRRMSDLEKQVRLNMSLKKDDVRLQEEQEGAKDTVNIHVDTDPHTDMAAYDEVCKMLDEGKLMEVKEKLKKYMTRTASESSAPEDVEANLSALTEAVAKLQSESDEIVKLINNAIN